MASAIKINSNSNLETIDDSSISSILSIINRKAKIVERAKLTYQ